MQEKMNNYIRGLNSMWTDNKVLIEDMEHLNELTYIPWDRLENAVLLITGATGLIGTNIINGLVYVNRKKDLNLRIIALVRDAEKADKKFAGLDTYSDVLTFMEGDVEHLPYIEQHIDYIIHGAAPTASSYFVEHPVETIATAVTGTMNILKLALDKHVQGFIFLSSMEVYGGTTTEEMLSEKDVGYMDPLNIRNSYSESKRMCETMIASYAGEYDLPAMSVRLAQTFGVGVEKNDARVFAEFARCATEKRDIVLLTNGGSKHCYLYTMDAVSAILTVLLKGEKGKSYNAGNPETYCSIKEMAQMVAHELADDEIMVTVSENNDACKKYPPVHFYNLGIKAISELGWRPTCRLVEMYKRMMGI